MFVLNLVLQLTTENIVETDNSTILLGDILKTLP
jgi:hypothetical protein